MKKLALFFLLTFAGIPVLQAQTNADTTSKKALKNQPAVNNRVFPALSEPKITPGKTRKVNASDQIRQLKAGVLLVRLRTSEIGIEKLTKAGNKQLAATRQRQQTAENQRIIHAFKTQFDFCPVYFFYSSDTEKVKSGATSGYFLNKNLTIDNAIALPDTNFFIVELTDLEQFRENPDSPQESNNAEVSFRALVIRDRNFHQLAKPFPYFIKASSNFPPRKRSEAEMVDLMNARLATFYKGQQRKLKK